MGRAPFASSVAAAALLVAPVPAAAQTYTEPMPVRSVQPASGRTIQPDPFGITFEVKTFNGLGRTPLELEVASRNVLGADGTLANDLQLERKTLFERQSEPGTYQGTTRGAGFRWSRTPGTYFWQLSAIFLDLSTFPSTQRYLRSPVYTIRISSRRCFPTVPQREIGLRPALARSTAALYARRCLQARRPRVRCLQTGNTDTGSEAYGCTVTWRRGGRRRSRVLNVFYNGGQVIVRPAQDI